MSLHSLPPINEPDYQLIENYLKLKADKQWKAVRRVYEDIQKDDTLMILLLGFDAKKKEDIHPSYIAIIRNTINQIFEVGYYPLLHAKACKLMDMIENVDYV